MNTLSSLINDLTEQEFAVIAKVGMNPHIKETALADDLGMNQHTFRHHIESARGKLHLKPGRGSITLWAVDAGLLVPNINREE